MEPGTHITAELGKQELFVRRVFDAPPSLVYRAYSEADLLEAWMGTKVLKLDMSPQGAYVFETVDPKGNTHRFQGCIHKIIPGEQIIRTFEMENTGFPVQMEYLQFEAMEKDQCILTMQMVFQSVDHRDALLKMPFAQGINMAHNRLQAAILNQSLI